MKWPEKWTRVLEFWGDRLPQAPLRMNVRFWHGFEDALVDSWPPRRQRVTRCSVEVLDDDARTVRVLGDGRAALHPTDHFRKAKGRDIAFRRAWAEAKKALGLERRPHAR